MPSVPCELSTFAFWECLFSSIWYVSSILIVIHVNILTVIVIKMHKMIRVMHNGLVFSNLTITKHMTRIFSL